MKHTNSKFWRRGAMATAALAMTATNSFAEIDADTISNNDEVRSIVAEMLADAETRSSMLQSGNAGHDGKFFMSSADGAFRLNVGGYTQFRYYANFREDTAGDDDYEGGFKHQRVRLVFSGKIYENLSFVVRPAAGPSGTWGLLDAWVKTDLGDGWSLKWGQFKLPVWREWNNGETYNHGVERSIVTSVFSSLYAQGVQLAYGDDSVRGSLTYSDGFRSANTDFTSPVEADWSITGNLQFLGEGNWGQFKDLTSLGNDDFGWMFGVGANFQGETASYQGSGLAVDSAIVYSADLSFEGKDWNLFIAGIGRALDDTSGGTLNEYAFLVDGGLFINDKTELIASWSTMMPDDDAANDDAFNTLGAGFNYYMHGHAAKFTLDFLYFLDDPNDSDITGFGTHTDVGLLSAGDDGQLVIRAQFQLIF